MRYKINEMLDSVYELEGLLHLMLNREDIPEALPRLVRQKALRVAELGAAFAEPESASASACEPIAEPEPVVAPEPIAAPEPVVVAEVVTTPEVVAEPVIVADPEAVVEPVVETTAPATHADAMPVFSLNDKFLYTRQLFDGSRAAFDDAMRRVAEMESEDEAEAYFIDTLGWDPEDVDVAGFMKIIVNYLNHG